MSQAQAPSDTGERSTARLYRATLGEAAAERYLPVFARFDDQGLAGPVWSSAAAFFHLGWLLHHRLWLALSGCLVLATGVVLGIVGLWYGAPGWPTGIKLGASLALAFGAMLVPGLWGLAWLHTQTRRRMIAAVERAATVDGACEALAVQARDRQRRNTWGLVGGLSAVALAVVLGFTVPWDQLGQATPVSAETPSAGPVASAPPVPTETPVPASDPVAIATPTVEASPERQPAPDPLPVTPPVVDLKPGSVEPSPTADAAPAPAAPVVLAMAEAGVAAPGPGGRMRAPAKKAVPVVQDASQRLPPPAPEKPVDRAQMANAASAAPQTSASQGALADYGDIRPRVKGFGVAVGMFAVADNAERVKAQLAGAGLPVLSDPVDSARGRLTRVRVGPYEQRAQAEAAAAKIKALGLEARVYTP